ncbi:bifunctional chorismate mutase/prephenate dehydratase [Trinickia diaoshuihuensis]|uniref:bifunctional chorismate mutase/prephenate dehydratase n=1 Tax=Trinickia diaoshuihuensis TaxID=2292265 RepID=UPI000E25246D|nr:bifunctional chorismate mutase/prephenate dehydratase [Trinickia diaoshuihuensis]
MTPLELAPPPTVDDAIAACRTRIDSIDADLLALIVQRVECAAEIGRLKRRGGLPVYHPGRESAIVANLCARSHGALRDDHVASIWGALFSASREVQGAPSVAFLGPAGTYTEAAARQHFGDAVRIDAQETLEDVFAALSEGDTEFAVVPIENSTEGTITRTVDLLAQYTPPITGEIEQAVVHCLLGANASLEGVECVLGHEQALAQCRAWLDTHAPRLRRIAVSSNGAAAREAAEHAHCAAIAGEPAARRYGLRVLARAIQDDPNNRTRFLVLGGPSPDPTGDDRTSLSFAPSDGTDELARLFAVLARRGIDMLWLAVRPGRTPGLPYRYFADLSGHARDARVREALDDLGAGLSGLRVLGAYPRGRLNGAARTSPPGH